MSILTLISDSSNKNEFHSIYWIVVFFWKNQLDRSGVYLSQIPQIGYIMVPKGTFWSFPLLFFSLFLVNTSMIDISLIFFAKVLVVLEYFVISTNRIPYQILSWCLSRLEPYLFMQLQRHTPLEKLDTLLFEDLQSP